MSPATAISTSVPAAMDAASKEEKKKANFSFSSSSMPKRVDCLFIAAPPRVDCCVDIDRGGTPVLCEEKSEFSSSSSSSSFSSLPERQPGR